MYRMKNEKQCSSAVCSLMTLWRGLKIYRNCQQENNCPDFCFYLAETLMVIDHQKKAPAFRPVCLLRMKKKNNVSLLALLNFANS